jgi:hypothetical protein
VSVATQLAPAHLQHTNLEPSRALADAHAVIVDAILNHPRSLQTTIGPSELGNPCTHCLAARLAGWKRTDDGTPWLPTIGTAVHAWLEDVFTAHELATGTPSQHRYLTEAAVMVGHVGGQPIWGSTDLVDLYAGLTVDWKIVGAATLRKARTGPSDVYRAQAHLYAKGWNDAGYRVGHVSIAYLPRNSVSLDQAIWWTEPYDPDLAAATLARADRVATNLAALATLGTDAVTAWISDQPRDPHCYDCARYPDGAGLLTPGHHPRGDDLQDLIA